MAGNFFTPESGSFEAEEESAKIVEDTGEIQEIARETEKIDQVTFDPEGASESRGDYTQAEEIEQAINAVIETPPEQASAKPEMEVPQEDQSPLEAKSETTGETTPSETQVASVEEESLETEAPAEKELPLTPPAAEATIQADETQDFTEATIPAKDIDLSMKTEDDSQIDLGDVLQDPGQEQPTSVEDLGQAGVEQPKEDVDLQPEIEQPENLLDTLGGEGGEMFSDQLGEGADLDDGFGDQLDEGVSIEDELGDFSGWGDGDRSDDSSGDDVSNDTASTFPSFGGDMDAEGDMGLGPSTDLEGSSLTDFTDGISESDVLENSDLESVAGVPGGNPDFSPEAVGGLDESGDSGTWDQGGAQGSWRETHQMPAWRKAVGWLWSKIDQHEWEPEKEPTGSGGIRGYTDGGDVNPSSGDSGGEEGGYDPTAGGFIPNPQNEPITQAKTPESLQQQEVDGEYSSRAYPPDIDLSEAMEEHQDLYSHYDESHTDKKRRKVDMEDVDTSKIPQGDTLDPDVGVDTGLDDN